MLMGGTTCNMIGPLLDIGFDSQEVQRLASKLHMHFADHAAKRVHTRRALSSTITSSPYAFR